MTTAEGPSHWWAETGPDTCELCLITFYIEVGYYCAGCDRPMCPSCVVVVLERKLKGSHRDGSVTLCPECSEGREA